MTRDEIYDHLAQVYLGKRSKKEEKKKNHFNVWLLINISITFVIFTSLFYGLSAFLTKRNLSLHNSVIFSLTNSPIRIVYNLDYPFPPVKTFSLTIPSLNTERYQKLNFSIRGLEEGYPGVVKITIKNSKNEIASFFVRNVGLDWQEVSIPLEKFEQISDWSTLTDISFVLESWNAEKKKGIILIENVAFAS